MVAPLLASAFALASLWRPLRELRHLNADTSQAHIVFKVLVWLSVGLFVPSCFFLIIVRGFHGMRLIYHAGVFSALVCGVALAAAIWVARRGLYARTMTGLIIICSPLLLLTPVALWMTLVEPYRLQIEQTTHTVPKARQGSASVRIALLADIQTAKISDWERRISAEVAKQAPDLIILPGDVLQSLTPEDFNAQLPQMRAFLNTLKAPYGVYLVSGDVDRDAQTLIQGTHLELLDNKTKTLKVKDRLITLSGIPLQYWEPQNKAYIEQVERMPDQGDIRLMVAHRPGATLTSMPQADSRIDLFLTGHTHGGQIVLPLFGPPVTFSVVPRKVAAGGLHKLGSRWLYVSRGLGAERDEAPLLRFNCPPELSIIELK